MSEKALLCRIDGDSTWNNFVLRHEEWKSTLPMELLSNYLLYSITTSFISQIILTYQDKSQRNMPRILKI